ncbi:MAG: hypothetical protein OJJ21_06670 [Ferrovibrio sp.]|uniref:hypothetical protein n=1 Tax=Ferrovibrio sp. TaxID=1917215 RepID=UPI002617F1C8|nr:hypothetical protein [Ferrovibrio sp.]MCW0233262.1 hypothetical protein [Ferrovibrio sp.]
MLDWKSENTYVALRKLVDLLEERRRPVVVWIGAGVSKWSGYPLWDEMADDFYKKFSRHQVGFDKTKASELKNKTLPAFFDYCEKSNPEMYRRMLAETFSPKPVIAQYSIIFIGYSIRDNYILNLLERSSHGKPIFGDGPHFAILPIDNNEIPGSVEKIIYTPEPQKDHRSAIRVLEASKYLKISAHSPLNGVQSFAKVVPKSIHFITDVMPPGKWSSSSRFEFAPVGDKIPSGYGYVGHGVNDFEFPHLNSTAMHDLVVGLLCFDQVIMPLNAVGRVHTTLGSQVFWALIDLDILKFIHWETQDGVMFSNEDPSGLGGIASISNVTDGSASNVIKRQILPVPGKEKEAQENFDLLVKNTTIISDRDISNVPEFVRGLLVYPDIRKSLGISEGVPVKTVPPWLMFPILRLAQVVRVGLTCNLLNVPSTKLLFGLSGLAGPVFSACSAGLWVDQIASYVVAGELNAHVGEVFIQSPQLIFDLLKFRETTEGINLRCEILAQMSTNEAGEVSASINGGLKSCIAHDILDRARKKFSGLMICDQPLTVSALWNNNDYDLKAMGRWKLRIAAEFKEFCAQHKISLYDQCPCGSGEKVKFCCLPLD